MFVGIVCLVVGVFTRDVAYGRVLIALGLTLGALGGLDTSVREHFAGYRSHTLVLAAFPAVAATVVMVGRRRACVPRPVRVTAGLRSGLLGAAPGLAPNHAPVGCVAPSV